MSKGVTRLAHSSPRRGGPLLARDVCRAPHCDKSGHTAQTGPTHAGSMCLPPASRSAAGFFLAPAHRDGTGNVHHAFAGAGPVGGPPGADSVGGQRLLMSGWAKKKSTSLTAIKVASYLSLALSPSLPLSVCSCCMPEPAAASSRISQGVSLILKPTAGASHRGRLASGGASSHAHAGLLSRDVISSLVPLPSCNDIVSRAPLLLQARTHTNTAPSFYPSSPHHLSALTVPSCSRSSSSLSVPPA